MGFLTPIALALGAAVAIPIILHLFQRHQGPRLIFPALRYLRRAEREHARRIKLRQLLLLALRVLAILFLAAAAARPFLRSGGAAHAPSAVVLVLDNSASTGAIEADRRVIDVLKDRAIETLTRAGPDDRFWLLRAGSPWEPALHGDATTMADRVRETEPTASAANLRAAVERAATLASAGADGRALEVQLLSDLQASNLSGTVARPPGDVAFVVWEPGGGPPPNRGVADIEIGGGLAPRAGARSTATVRIAGGKETDTTNIRIVIGGRTAAAGIAPSGTAAVLQLPAQPEGMLTGFAEIDADALRADDRRFFAVRVEPIPAVALGRTLPFLEEALTVLADAKRVQPATPGAADIIIAPGGAGLESVRPDAGVVVLPPESPVEVSGLNRRLASAGINWRFGSSSTSGEARFGEQAAGGDPLLRQLAGVRLQQTYTLMPTSSVATDSITLRLLDGQPWAVRGLRASGGRFVLLGSPLTAEAGSLPTSPALVPLLDVIIGAWSAKASAAHDATPGEPISLPKGAAIIAGPDGARDTLANGESYRAPEEPGVYKMLDETGTDLGAFVINTSPLETPLQTASARRVRDVFTGWDIEFADRPEEWVRDIYRERLGRELWWPVIVALLLLLLVESLAAAAGRVGAVHTTRATGQPSPASTARSLTG
jgi:aerotolerance regulator-like protein